MPHDLTRSWCLLALLLAFVLKVDRTTDGQDALNGNSRLTWLDGRSTRVDLLTFNSNGDLIVRIGQQPETVASNQVFRYGTPRPSIQLDTIILKNGTRLACVVTGVSPDKVTLNSRLFQLSSIPSEKILGIRFRQIANRQYNQQILDQILFRRREQFQAVLQNQDIANGDLIDSEKEKEIRLSYQDITRAIPFSELGDLRYPLRGGSADSNDTERVPLPEKSAAMRLGLIDGSRIVFRELLVDDSNVTLVIDEDFRLTAPLSKRNKSFFDRVCYFQPKAEKYRFLSQQRPLKLVEKSQDHLLNTRFDRSVVGGPLLSGGQEFEFGIGTHSGSQIIYAVKPADKLFRASIALDQSANQLGNVSCRVLLLGTDNQWAAATKTFSISRDDPIQTLSVKVEGARAIGLVTSPGSFGGTGDRVNWIDARMHQ